MNAGGEEGEERKSEKKDGKRQRPRERWREVAHRHFCKSETAPGRSSSYEKSFHLNLKVRCLWTISFQVLFFIYIPPSSHSFLKKKIMMIYNINPYSTGQLNNQRPCGEGVMLVIPRICCRMVGDLVFHSVLSLLAAKAKRETQWVT